mmetsp:Transcript_143438/g.253167  ORF Transcript_143438/g.253167 Transcript_143438/m.253167 type:complete len:232 (+) Transcript_143438:268-963(+)
MRFAENQTSLPSSNVHKQMLQGLRPPSNLKVLQGIAGHHQAVRDLQALQGLRSQSICHRRPDMVMMLVRRDVAIAGATTMITPIGAATTIAVIGTVAMAARATGETTAIGEMRIIGETASGTVKGATLICRVQLQLQMSVGTRKVHPHLHTKVQQRHGVCKVRLHIRKNLSMGRALLHFRTMCTLQLQLQTEVGVCIVHQWLQMKPGVVYKLHQHFRKKFGEALPARMPRL